MPFLVDSVTAELSSQDRAIHIVIHPLIVVRRDVTGSLLGVLDLGPSARHREDFPRDALVESWIHVEIDRETDPGEVDRLSGRLRSILEDVRVAVEDWPRIVARAAEVAADLEAAPPVGIPEEEVTEARQLLGWLCQDHFTFLGYREYQLVMREGQEALVAGQRHRPGDPALRPADVLGELRAPDRRRARQGPGEEPAGAHQGELTRNGPPTGVPRLRRCEDLRRRRGGGRRAQVHRPLRVVGVHRERAPHPGDRPQDVGPAGTRRLQPRQPLRQGPAADPRDLPARRALRDLLRPALRDRVVGDAPAGASPDPAVPAQGRLRPVRLVPGLPAARPVHHCGAAADGGDPQVGLQRGDRRLHHPGQRVRPRPPALRHPGGVRHQAARCRPRGARAPARRGHTHLGRGRHRRDAQRRR